ncbi:MAG: hypothetical protein ABEH83_02020 [Halobacterium sp.]
MEKVMNNNKSSAGGRSGLGNALAALDHYVGDLYSIAWKVGLFFAVWITGSYLWMTNAATGVGVQVTAIAFWFGWLFLGATVALGVVVILMGLVDRVRLSRSKRKY